jgi:peptidylprolyl isomerase
MLPRHRSHNNINTKKKMKLSTFKLFLGAAALSSAGVAAYSFSSSRRNFLAKSATTAAVSAAVASGSLVKPAVAADEDASDPYADYVTAESGLRYKIIKEGDGATPTSGQTVKTQYTGWLDGFNSEKKFDSSRDRNRPFTFRAGAGQVIRGWDESFLDMKVKRVFMFYY